MEGLKNVVNVAREDVLDGGYRAFCRTSFNARRKLSVRFSGEDGVDSGGPTREFLRLAMYALKESSLFVGPAKAKTVSLDYKGT